MEVNMSTNETLYIEKKCKDCGQTFELRKDMADTLYGDYCPICFFKNVKLYADGTMEQKKKTKKDTSYKDELAPVSHRGRHKVNYDMTDQWRE
jgi:hypothetical protein